MMTARADAFPFEPTCTDGGLTAASAVSPARYWPGGVPAGTRTMNGSFSAAPAGSVTSPARALTQQPVPEHRWNDRLKALPPLLPVTPVARLIFSFSVTFAAFLIRAVSATDSPAAIVNVK